MRYLILSLSFVLLPAGALADPTTRASACYGVSDADARSFCLARAHGDTSRCYSVQRADLRQQCLAEVRR